MKKRILSLSLFVFSCLLLSLCGTRNSQAETYVPVGLEDGDDDNAIVEDSKYVFDIYFKEGYAKLRSAKAPGNELIVPDSVTYQGKVYPITYFQTFSNLEWEELPYQTITLPDCVQYISISQVKLPLTKINIPKSMKKLWIRDIEQKIQYVVPDEMEHYDFKNNALYSKKNPGKLVYALSVPEKYSIAEGTTNLGRDCFYSTSANRYIEEITLPSSLEEMQKGTFMLCEELKKVNMARSKVKVLSEYSFSNTKKLKEVSLPKTLETITFCAFSRSGISSLSIPSKVIDVEVQAFVECKKLKSITLEGTKKIPIFEPGSFKDARSGIKFYVKNKKMAKRLKKNLKGSKIKKAKIYAGKKKKLVYKNVNS